ncbi:hypothetical protein Y1Q_0010406 [Alligator mississippiensis]|uniref:Uncharacterized protein n=1 Tax=Alligator mississippiensis TaxID=8496 RepID=A0A151MPH4_ALLMI|nr:hypothetical protein Y1Q_0010406 [Alligator mississippiensis]
MLKLATPTSLQYISHLFGTGKVTSREAVLQLQALWIESATLCYEGECSMTLQNSLDAAPSTPPAEGSGALHLHQV